MDASAPQHAPQGNVLKARHGIDWATFLGRVSLIPPMAGPPLSLTQWWLVAVHDLALGVEVDWFGVSVATGAWVELKYL